LVPTKKDETVADDIAGMTYGEVTHRMTRLMYAHYQQRWVDRSLPKLVSGWLRRAEERFIGFLRSKNSESKLQSYQSPQPIDLHRPVPQSLSRVEATARCETGQGLLPRHFPTIGPKNRPLYSRPGRKLRSLVQNLKGMPRIVYKSRLIYIALQYSLWQGEDMDAAFDHRRSQACECKRRVYYRTPRRYCWGQGIETCSQ
jgi:hypothetical protein